MDIYPAIDIKGGRVVRMIEGPSRDETVYGDDPYAQAQTFVEAGARWLHVVDMDRAFETGEDNTDWIRRMAMLDGVRIQVGGNISDAAWAHAAVEAGADRVILGTAAAVEGHTFEELVDDVGAARCGLAIDVRKGEVALRGQRGPLRQNVERIVNRALDRGVRIIVFRDLDRDGTATGADIDGAKRVAATGAQVIAAGGVHGLQDIRAAREAGLTGVIVGRALYERLFTLQEAHACLL